MSGTTIRPTREGEEVDEPLAKPWVIVGCGRLGTALGIAGASLGIEVRATWNRTETTAASTAEQMPETDRRWGPVAEAFDPGDFDGAVVWLTVVDDAVAEVAADLADLLGGADLVLHACGSRDSRVLADAGITTDIGSLHPLLAVTDPVAAAQRLGECVWTVEGGEHAGELAGAWTDALGATLLEVDAGTRALYHASAATAANLVVALFDAALAMADAAGIGREDARTMLLPLIASSVDNLRDQSTGDALSGPAAREDTGTIARHREALAEVDEELAAIYDVLTGRALGLGESD